jgi:phenylacetate-CoA ligase
MKPIFLEEWVHKRIEDEVRKDVAIKDFPGEDYREFCRANLEKFMLYKLKKILTYVYEKSPFYREIFDKHQVHPTEVRSLSDLSKIPFTNSNDISNDPYRILCVSIGSVSRIFSLTSSGTTGNHKKVFFTQGDLHRIVGLLAAHTKIVCGDRKSVVQILLPGSRPFGQADLLAKGVEMTGSIPVVSGVASDPMEQFETIKKNQSTVLVGYPSHLYRMMQEIRQKYNLEDLGVNTIVTTGENIPLSMRSAIKGVWKADLFSHYGLAEMGLSVGIECCVHQGYHIDEADFIVEIVDPCSDKVLEEEREGEIVITTLSREGMPLIRYRTGDLSKIIKRGCECGSILRRIDMMNKRVGSGIKLGNIELYPSTFDEAIFSIPEVVDYQVVAREEEGKVKLLFNIESLQGGSTTQFGLERVISEHHLFQGLMIKNEVEYEVAFVSRHQANNSSHANKRSPLKTSFG